MARIKKALKKAQFGKDTTKKVYSASFKYAIGDSVAMKKKIAEDSTARKKKTDSLGLSTSRAQDLLKARMAAKKQRDGGKTAAWTRKEGKNPEGGLNAKGVASYRAANPGSKLKTAVTTKPSKLKKGSKAAKRRKSFCARMSGVKGPMKKPNGKPTRKALSLRKWNC
jgi:hypothetical protein